jgi:hypothetical protein
MSQLIITSLTQSFTMNVTGFDSPMYATISSAQTNTLAVYFPIKMSQPDLAFDVVFASQTDFMNFQNFVRNHQQAALLSMAPVILNWPARNITNFTGVIQKFQAGGMRGQYAPTARFTVSLFQSMVSTRTTVASVANPWMTVYGMGLADGVLGQPSAANAALALNSVGEAVLNIGGTSTNSMAGTAVSNAATSILTNS